MPKIKRPGICQGVYECLAWEHLLAAQAAPDDRFYWLRMIEKAKVMTGAPLINRLTALPSTMSCVLATDSKPEIKNLASFYHDASVCSTKRHLRVTFLIVAYCNYARCFSLHLVDFICFFKYSVFMHDAGIFHLCPIESHYTDRSL